MQPSMLWVPCLNANDGATDHNQVSDQQIVQYIVFSGAANKNMDLACLAHAFQIYNLTLEGHSYSHYAQRQK